MFSFFNFLLLCLLFLTCSALNQEAQSLVSLAKSLSLPHSVQSSWNSSDPTPCQWAGIICDSKNRVISLNLSRHEISGRLGPEIGQLRVIKAIDLASNSLSGSIPPEITNCTQLEHFDISFNSFTGTLPQNLEHLQNLRIFSIFNNHISGGVPSSLFMIPNLIVAFLAANNLSGPIPHNIGNATKLESAILCSNRLSGTIPETIGNSCNLIELDLYDNQFTGVLPSSLTNLKNLKSMDFSVNRFTGEIPSAYFGDCTSLMEFAATENGLSGGIPSSMGNCKKVHTILLSMTMLSGTIPPELGNMALLEMLDLSSNQFTGDLPPELGNLGLLQLLDVSCNSLTGNLAAVGKLKSLVEVNVSYNHFHGAIPEQFVKSLNQSTSSFVGNQGLCVTCQPERKGNCAANFKVSPCTDHAARERKSINGGTIALIVVGISMMGALVVFVLGCIIMTHKKKSDEVVEAAEYPNMKGGDAGHGTVYKDPRERITAKGVVKQNAEGGVIMEHI